MYVQLFLMLRQVLFDRQKKVAKDIGSGLNTTAPTLSGSSLVLIPSRHEQVAQFAKRAGIGGVLFFANEAHRGAQSHTPIETHTTPELSINFC